MNYKVTGPQNAAVKDDRDQAATKVGLVTVAQVTTVHAARDVRVYHKMARSLAAKGYRVIIIHPGDELGQTDGVEFVGLSLGPDRLRRFLTGWPRAFWAGVQSGASILHFHDPELIFAGFLWKALGRRVVYDVHEDLPRDISTKAWIPKVLRPFVSAIAEGVERLAGIVFDGVVAATTPIKSRFRSGRSIVAHNFPEDISQFRAFATTWECRGHVAVYTGLLSRSRGLSTMVRAMSRLPSGLSATLTLAGPMREVTALEEVRELPGWARVHYEGIVSRKRVTEILGTARIGLCVLTSLPQFKESVPIKLFEYMAAGIPVIVSDFPGWRATIEAAQCGLLVPPDDPDALAAAMLQLLSNPTEAQRMGANGRRAVEERYNWDVEVTKVLDMYEAFVGRHA